MASTHTVDTTSSTSSAKVDDKPELLTADTTIVPGRRYFTEDAGITTTQSLFGSIVAAITLMLFVGWIHIITVRCCYCASPFFCVGC